MGRPSSLAPYLLLAAALGLGAGCKDDEPLTELVLVVDTTLSRIYRTGAIVANDGRHRGDAT